MHTRSVEAEKIRPDEAVGLKDNLRSELLAGTRGASECEKMAAIWNARRQLSVHFAGAHDQGYGQQAQAALKP